jgi:hypothetical protein
MKVGLFHSQQGDATPHHNNNQCPVGGKISPPIEPGAEKVPTVQNNAGCSVRAGKGWRSGPCGQPPSLLTGRKVRLKSGGDAQR